MAEDHGSGRGQFGQSGVSFTALIQVLQANNLSLTALLNDINNSVKALPVNVAPTYGTGAWVPTDHSGAALAFTGVSANWTQSGRMTMAYAQFTYPTTADGSNASIAGLPTATANAGYATGPAKVYCSASVDVILRPVANTLTATFLNGATGAAIINSALSAATVSFILIYPTS